MELRPKPIVRPRTHSLDQSLPFLEELMQHGQITLGNVGPVGCVAVAHDGRQSVAMLLRREGETVTQLLTRLELAIAKRLRKGPPLTKSTRSASNTSPQNNGSLLDF